MRTEEELTSYLKKKYKADNNTFLLDESQPYDEQLKVCFHGLSEELNACLIKLWNDEEIVDVKIFNEKNPNDNSSVKLVSRMICLTNKCRMIICREATGLSDFLIFSFASYSNDTEVIELKRIDHNKCRVLEHKNTSFFGKPKPAIFGDLILDDKPVFDTVNLKVLNGVYRAILNNIKKYAQPPKPKKEEPASAKEIAPPPPSNNVAEIRKLYEDGIITKEEMLDLIKSLAK